MSERTITINQDLAFCLLDVLRLTRVYALMGSEHEAELGDDFKPWKWRGYELEHAQKAADAARQLLAQMEGQVKPPPLTYEQKIEALERMVYPDPDKCAEYVPARVRYGQRWHTGYLTVSWGKVRIRDSSRAPRSQYVFLHEFNIDTVQLRQANGRYAPAFD